MNEKEKAKELVDKFHRAIGGDVNDYFDSIKCALIDINHTIESHESYKPSLSNMLEVGKMLDELYQVRKEIEAL